MLKEVKTYYADNSLNEHYFVDSEGICRKYKKFDTSGNLFYEYFANNKKIYGLYKQYKNNKLNIIITCCKQFNNGITIDFNYK